MVPGGTRSEIFNLRVVLSDCKQNLSSSNVTNAVEEFEAYLAADYLKVTEMAEVMVTQAPADDGNAALILLVAVMPANATAAEDVSAKLSEFTHFGATPTKSFFSSRAELCDPGVTVTVGDVFSTYVVNPVPPSPLAPSPPLAPPPLAPSPFVLSSSKYCVPIDDATEQVYLDSLADLTLDECASACLDNATYNATCAGYFYGESGDPETNLGKEIKLDYNLSVCVLLTSNCLCPQHEETYTGLLIANEGYEVAYKREVEEQGCLAPDFTKVGYGCTADAILMYDAATVIAAGTCDKDALASAGYNTSEQAWAAGEDETAAATDLWFPDATRCEALCAANPCCVLYTTRQATDCYLYDGTCLGENQDPQGGCPTCIEPNGTFLAASRSTLYKVAEVEAEEVNALVANGNADEIAESPNTVFQTCEGQSDEQDSRRARRTTRGGDRPCPLLLAHRTRGRVSG